VEECFLTYLMRRIQPSFPFVHTSAGSGFGGKNIVKFPQNSAHTFSPPIVHPATTIRTPWNGVSAPIWCAESNSHLRLSISSLVVELWAKETENSGRRVCVCVCAGKHQSAREIGKSRSIWRDMRKLAGKLVVARCICRVVRAVAKGSGIKCVCARMDAAGRGAVYSVRGREWKTVTTGSGIKCVCVLTRGRTLAEARCVRRVVRSWKTVAKGSVWVSSRAGAG